MKISQGDNEQNYHPKDCRPSGAARPSSHGTYNMVFLPMTSHHIQEADNDEGNDSNEIRVSLSCDYSKVR